MNDSPESVFQLIVGLGAMAALTWGLTSYTKRRAADPTDARYVFAADLGAASKLKPGRCSAALFRQSGNLARDMGVFDSPEDAIRAVQSSLGRAKIDTLRVTESTEARLEVWRAMRSNGGRAEGKKLAGAVIVSLA